MTLHQPPSTCPGGRSSTRTSGLLSAVAAAVTLASVSGAVVPVSAFAQDACDWDRLWPDEGSGTVSPYRSSFFLRGRPYCGVIDARLVRPDGSAIPILGGAIAGSWSIELRADPLGSPLDLEPDSAYTIEFSWYDTSYSDDLENARRLPARPYTFRTGAETDEDQPLTLDDLVVHRFEISSNAKLVTFDATWPDASPLYRIEFRIPSPSGDPAQRRSLQFFPAAEEPELGVVFDAGRTRGSDQTCAGLTIFADSVLGGETTMLSECTPSGCATVQAAPSLVGFGVLGLLFAGRRRRGAGPTPG
jgi:hypothetical protein